MRGDPAQDAHSLLQLVVKFDLIDDYSWKYIQNCDDRLLINKLTRTSSANTTENVSPKAKEPEGKRALRLTYVRKGGRCAMGNANTRWGDQW